VPASFASLSGLPASLGALSRAGCLRSASSETCAQAGCADDPLLLAGALPSFTLGSASASGLDEIRRGYLSCAKQARRLVRAWPTLLSQTSGRRGGARWSRRPRVGAACRLIALAPLPQQTPSLRRPIHPTLLSERREAAISSLLPAHSSRDLSSPTRDADGSRRSVSRDPCRSRRPQPRPPPCPLVAPSRPRSTRRRNVKSLSVNSSLASQARLALRGTLQVRPCLRPALVSLGAERPCLSSRTHAAAATACPFPAQPAVSPRLRLPGRPEPSSKLALVSPISLAAGRKPAPPLSRRASG